MCQYLKELCRQICQQKDGILNRTAKERIKKLKNKIKKRKKQIEKIKIRKVIGEIIQRQISR